MKRTISIKLGVTGSENQALLELQQLFSEVCNRIAEIAEETGETNRVRLHHKSYAIVRGAFPLLGSQMACNAIGKVSQALKAKKHKKKSIFKKTGSVHFDKRTYSLKKGLLSLYTLKGRMRLSLDISAFHQNFLDSGAIREAELIRKGKEWFFNLVLDMPEVDFRPSGKLMAVDFGENNLAATSTGKLLGGGSLINQRDEYLAHRKRLQSNGSQSARQRLRKISGREKRHVKHVNHCVAKAIVLEAIAHDCKAIILEDLTNIRARIKAGKRMRTRLHRWAFDQLRQFVEYKAWAHGIRVIYVNPAYTSQTCCLCHSIGRRIRHRFSCSNCGSLQHSDLNASQNLLRRGVSADASTGDVNRRDVAA